MFEALDNSALTNWLNSFIWGFPAAEIFHLSMLGTFFGGMVMLDLRLLGFNRFISSRALLEYILKSIWIVFVGVLVSGFILFWFMPLEYSGNPAFLAKMCLIAIAGMNAFWMHKVLLVEIYAWDLDTPPPPGVRVCALFSLCLWVSVLACGRLIAYYYGF